MTAVLELSWPAIWIKATDIKRPSQVHLLQAKSHSHLICHIAGTRELLTVLPPYWDKLWPSGTWHCSQALQHLSLLLFGCMEAHFELHAFGQLCVSLTIFGMVLKRFSKWKPVWQETICLSSEEHPVLVWELPFFLQVLPWWTGSSPTALLCLDSRLSPWHRCWWMRTSSGPWGSAARRPRAPATPRRSSSMTPPHCTCLWVRQLLWPMSHTWFGLEVHSMQPKANVQAEKVNAEGAALVF